MGLTADHPLKRKRAERFSKSLNNTPGWRFYSLHLVKTNVIPAVCALILDTLDIAFYRVKSR
jgi:hypothetical protein